MKLTVHQLRQLIREVAEDPQTYSDQYARENASINSKANTLKDQFLDQGNVYDVKDPNAYSNLKKFVYAKNPGDPQNNFVVEKMAQDFERTANDARLAATTRGYRSRVIPNL